MADLHHEFVPNPGAYRVVPVESFQANKEVKMGPVVESVTILGNEPFKINFFFFRGGSDPIFGCLSGGFLSGVIQEVFPMPNTNSSCDLGCSLGGLFDAKHKW